MWFRCVRTVPSDNPIRRATCVLVYPCATYCSSSTRGQRRGCPTTALGMAISGDQVRSQQGEQEPVALAEVSGATPPEHQPHPVPGLVGEVDRHLPGLPGNAEFTVHRAGSPLPVGVEVVRLHHPGDVPGAVGVVTEIG